MSALTRLVRERPRDIDWHLQWQKLEAMGYVTSAIAHDVNNMLAVILGNVDFIKEQLPADSPLLDFILPAIQAAEQGVQMAQQLLAFGCKQALRPQIIPLNDAVRRFCQQKLHFPENMTPTITLPDHIGNVLVDAHLLDEALKNIVRNACDAMPAGGTLEFETNTKTYSNGRHGVPPGVYCVLAIRDSGCGMSSDIMEHAFDPFFTTKHPGRGVGLGLSMVYGFVKQNAGHVTLASELGRSSSVLIFLPRQ